MSFPVQLRADEAVLEGPSLRETPLLPNLCPAQQDAGGQEGNVALRQCQQREELGWTKKKEPVVSPPKSVAVHLPGLREHGSLRELHLCWNRRHRRGGLTTSPPRP